MWQKCNFARSNLSQSDPTRRSRRVNSVPKLCASRIDRISLQRHRWRERLVPRRASRCVGRERVRCRGVWALGEWDDGGQRDATGGGIRFPCLWWRLSCKVGTSKGSRHHTSRHCSRCVHVIRRDYNCRCLVALVLPSSEGSQLPLMPYFVNGLASANLKAALQGNGFALLE